MGSLLLAHCRALFACASIAIAAAGGCSTTAANSGSTVSGHTLTVYLSKPAGSLTGEEQDVLSAEQLALQQLGRKVSSFTVKPVVVSGNELSDNARAAISDPTTIAYLGELESGTSGQTIGITNAQDILQVTPTDDALELTQSVPEVPGSPDLYYESLSSNGRTFARVVPTDKLEMKALVGELPSLGVKRLYIKTDGSQYGAVLNGLIVADASPGGITIASTPAQADAMFYAGGSPSAAAAALSEVASTSPTMKLFASSDLATGSLSAAAQRNLYVISPGFSTTDLPSGASQFAAAFKTAYGHAPAPEAIFGYAAMQTVLAALHKAGSSANSRGTVVKDFFALRNRSSVLGTYSINSDGDISFASGAPFLFSHVHSGALVPFKAVQQQG